LSIGGGDEAAWRRIVNRAAKNDQVAAAQRAVVIDVERRAWMTMVSPV